MEIETASRAKAVSMGLLRWGLFLIVLWFVATQAKALWDANRDIDVQFDWKFLFAAGVVSQLSWLPSTWFWQRLIVLLGDSSRTYPLIRAYYCGSLGKYMPGKAAVILIRSALLKQQNVSFIKASIASMVEAGAIMLVGCVVSLALLATVVPPETVPDWLPDTLHRESTSWSRLILIVAVLVAGTPLIAYPANWIFGKISRTVANRAQRHASEEAGPESISGKRSIPDSAPDDPAPGTLTWRFLTAASLMFALSWAGHGLSLLLVLRSMNSEFLTVEMWTITTAAAAAGTSIGFFAVFAPGGLAVREGLIIALLEPATGGAIAVAGASLYRLASLTAECVTALVLYAAAPRAEAPDSMDHSIKQPSGIAD